MVFSMPQFRYIQAARAGVQAAQLALKDAQEQVALDASTAYIEMDTVNRELEAAREQEQDAARLVAIEQQRAEAGVDPLSALLQAQLTAAQLKLKRLHLETRTATLAKQLADTHRPAGGLHHARSRQHSRDSRMSADEAPLSTPGIRIGAGNGALQRAGCQGRRRAPVADPRSRLRRPIQPQHHAAEQHQQLLRATTSRQQLQHRILRSAFPCSTRSSHAKARESAAEALRAKVEAEQAQQQNDIQIAELTASLRELDAQAEIASLKQQIAAEQLKSVMAQLELGNGAGNAPGAPPQLSPTAEQQARIDERQKYLDALDAGLDLSKARLNLLRALGHMQDWLNELHTK